MKVTANDTEAALALRFALLTPVERLRMTCGMFDAAKRLIVASVLNEEPQISEPELRVRIFDRLYPSDFDNETRVRLRAGLRRPVTSRHS